MGLYAYVLAGGRSSRFGADKARALLRGRPLILGVTEALRPAVASVTVVADREGKYVDLGLSTIADREPRKGPLEGLLTALRHRRAEHGDGWLLLAACDLVGLRAEWLDPLRQASGATGTAVAYVTDRWQPLLALYHTSIEPRVVLCRREGRLALWRLLDEVGATRVPFPGNPEDFRQANTPDDLQEP